MGWHVRVATLCLLVCGVTVDAAVAELHATAFPTASLHFEQNATDEDVEVVFEVQGLDDGLSELVVLAPDGRTVVDFKSPDASTLGIRQFRFETPEPAAEHLVAAYPEGEYRFSGRTNSGTTLVGTSTLSHRLPAVATFARPAPEAEDVPVSGVEISWGGVDGIASYIFELEPEDGSSNITVRLPGSANTFRVPEGFLVPGTEYQLGIGTVSDEGNISFVETSFTTGD